MKRLTLILTVVALLTACTEQRKNVWFKGNTHAHSTYSDGDTDVKELIKWYHDNEYNFLFVTDHDYPLRPDSIKLGFALRPDFILIPGNEISDAFGLHSSALNTTGRILKMGYYREKFKNGDISEAEFQLLSDKPSDILAMHVKNIHAAGGTPVLNHPNFDMGVQVADILPVKELKHMELFNGHPSVFNWGKENHSAVEVKWDSLLIHGMLVYGLASDDTHFLQQKGMDFANPGRGWIMVQAASLRSEDIMDAIQSGSFYASTGVFLKEYRVTDNVIQVVIDEKATLDELKQGRGYPRQDLKGLSAGFCIEFIGYNGKILKSEHITKAAYKIQPEDRYVRVRISYNAERDGHFDTYYAWSQPVEAERGFFK
jgi:hypothetical protein